MAIADSNSPAVPVSPARAREWSVTLLQHLGVPLDHATTISNCLVLADLRGVDTHGINRLAGYISRLQAGSLNPTPSLKFCQKTPVMASLDAENTFGFVAGCSAIDHCIGMAETYGMGVTAVKNSSHFGMAATYLVRAIEKGFGAMVFTNASKSMPPWGSKEPLLGTSPFAVGLPGGEKGDFVLDMSPSVVARGKVRKAARRGERIPDSWMLDADGKATTDPNEALKGTVLPIGGPKGSGLAMMMDLFGGLMTGSLFAGDVEDVYKDPSKISGVGHWFFVFRPEMFLDSKEEYTSRMDTFCDRVRGCELASGVQRVYMPGEIEAEKQFLNQKRGILFTAGEIDALHDLADGVGCGARLA